MDYAYNEMPWEEERPDMAIATKRAVIKGLKQERERIKNGWKYIKVGNVTKILVPCDEKGNPTQKGIEKICKLKELLGIK